MAWHDGWPTRQRRAGWAFKQFALACRAAGVKASDKRIREAVAGLPTSDGYTAEMIEAVRAYAGRKSRTRSK